MASCILLLTLAGNILGFESPLEDARQIAISSQAIESAGESIGFRRASNSVGQHDWPVAAPPSPVGSHRPTDSWPTGTALKSDDVIIEIDSAQRSLYSETPTGCSMESYSGKPSSAPGEEKSPAPSRADASCNGSSDGKDDCAICLGILDSDLRLLKCKHVFHRECIDGWLRGGRPMTCPSCRAEISGQNTAADQSPHASARVNMSPLGPTEPQPLDSRIQDEGHNGHAGEEAEYMSYARFAIGPTSYPGYHCSCGRLICFNFLVGIFSIIAVLFYIVVSKNKS